MFFILCLYHIFTSSIRCHLWPIFLKTVHYLLNYGMTSIVSHALYSHSHTSILITPHSLATSLLGRLYDTHSPVYTTSPNLLIIFYTMFPCNFITIIFFYIYILKQDQHISCRKRLAWSIPWLKHIYCHFFFNTKQSNLFTECIQRSINFKRGLYIKTRGPNCKL